MGQSGSRGPKITPQDRAILELKLQRDRVQQYQKKISVTSAREHDLAKEALARGQPGKARTALRRRKYHDSLLAKTDTQLETLEQLVSTIEFAQIQEAVTHGLKQGNSVLKEIHRVMNVESVEKLMEETAEAQAAQKEVDELLSSHMTAEEEDAVITELAELEREQAQDQPTPVAVHPDRKQGQKQQEDAGTLPAHKLPSPPTTEPEPADPASEPESALEREPQPGSSQPTRQALPA